MLISWLVGCLKIVILLGTLITIHELGHFLVARLCKVKVLKFAIGFGPKVFTKTKGQTEYTLRLIPFGGFVQMEGEEKRSEDKDAFNQKKVWQRMLIVLAGPFVNIIFALLIYFLIASYHGLYQSATISEIEDGSLAYAIGLQTEDRIVRVNGKKVAFGFQVDEKVKEAKNDEMTLSIDRKGEKLDLKVEIPTTKRGLLGVGFSGDRSITYIDTRLPVGSSELKVGDVVVAINGVTTYETNDIIEMIRSLPNQEISVTVLREMETYTYTIQTTSNEARFLDVDYEWITPTFWRNLGYAMQDTNWYLGANLKEYARLFCGKTENVEVMGVVGIAGEITKTSFLSEFFYLMCAISLSLGIFNLLPIPALDGGRFFLLLIEAIRGKPLSEKVEQYAIGISFFIIIIFALIVTFFDVSKLAMK